MLKDDHPLGQPHQSDRYIEDRMAEFYAKVEPPQEEFFIMQSMNDCLAEAAAQPDSKQLFGELWFENEICILYGDTGTGKSILAYQIANHLSNGIDSPILGMGVLAQKVLYLDCELSAKQVQMRYSANGVDYLFHPNFTRLYIAPGAVPPIGIDYDEHLVAMMEKKIIESKAQILVIDNLSYLKSDTEKARDANSLMKYLKVLKTKYNLSILVLAHTPKRDMSKPINKNDLAGSKALINFCDSAFAIGKSSQGGNLRYIKQIKERNVEQVYGPENVIVCSIGRQPENYLCMQPMGNGFEGDHLKEWTQKERDGLIEEVKELRDKKMTVREIAAKLNISKSVVSKYLNL